ncbi:hypothetical protein AB0M43_36220 [Longispora sp. NPDC051575]|uniref:hypothetical protein n=1 Tax=Longispora sp. NPDC051575 TaxID=3154943 RepID=UPI00342F18A9
MTKFADQIVEHFARAMQDLPRAVLEACDTVEALDDDVLRACAREAAKAAVAPIIWGKAVGERFTTAEAVTILNVSRQSLNKKVAQGALLGIPGRGTTYYPRWQFDEAHQRVRPVVRDIVKIFTHGGTADPFTIAAWATTPQVNGLGGKTPAKWIVDGGDVRQVIQAARDRAEKTTPVAEVPDRTTVGAR